MLTLYNIRVTCCSNEKTDDKQLIQYTKMLFYLMCHYINLNANNQILCHTANNELMKSTCYLQSTVSGTFSNYILRHVATTMLLVGSSSTKRMKENIATISYYLPQNLIMLFSLVLRDQKFKRQNRTKKLVFIIFFPSIFRFSTLR